MSLEQRYDLGHVDGASLASPQRMPNGWIRVDGFLTRTGIFTYRNPDGSERRELRLPEEVFKADALASFGLVPFTDDHPAGLLDATNTSQYIKGAVGEGVRQEGDYVRAPILVMDQATITKMQAGKVQLSCGYVCELDFTPGTYQGQRYDAIQRGIVGNHVALVDTGRAGDARVRMDASVMVADTPAEPNQSVVVRCNSMSETKKITLDSVEFEVSDSAAQAFAKHDAAQTEALNAERARADALTLELAKSTEALKVASDPAILSTAVEKRVALEVEARKHLGTEARLDASERGVWLAVIAKLDGETIADTEHDAYVKGRFDAAIKAAAKATPALDAARRAAVGNPAATTTPDLNKTRKDHADRQANAWKKGA